MGKDKLCGYKKCSICKEIKPLVEFGAVISCKLCNYIKLHNFISVEGWSEFECTIIIDYILNNKIKFINDFEDIFQNRSLNDFVDLLTHKIKIANKPLNIKTTCAYCGKEKIKKLSQYRHSNNDFCSSNCYWKYKREYEPRGENHSSFNRVEIKCDNCDCDIKVISYDIKHNKHNFCSQKCYWEFRSKYYVGENNYNFGMVMDQRQKDMISIAVTKLYSDGVYDRQTKPQKIINTILDGLNIKYTNEYNCKYYAIDNYLDDYNLMIEVMGDYFHTNPTKYLDINHLNAIQIKGLKRDKSKRTYVKKHNNIDVLYLWEEDIKSNLDLIKLLILEYIKHKGILEDYHSFNYHIEDNILKINTIKINSYVEQPLIKIKTIEEKRIS